MKELIFRPMREVLDEIVPPDVAQVATSLWEYADGSGTFWNTNEPKPGLDVDMAIYKGVVAGAMLMQGFADKDVAYFSTEELTEYFGDEAWDDETEDTFIGKLNRMMNGTDTPFVNSTVDLSTDTYHFAINLKFDNSVQAEQGPLVGNFYVLIAFIEAEGGAPSDVFIVREY